MGTREPDAITRPGAAMGTPPPRGTVVRIGPAGGWVALRPGELWSYRDLLWVFVWRDIRARYKQTVLGAAWAVIPPFCTMVVFSLFFGRLAGMPSEGVPYPVFVYSALVPWAYFANTLAQTSDSLVANEDLITKAYFPRLLIPLRVVLSGLVDLGIALVVLLLVSLAGGIAPTAGLLALPFFILLTAATALGAGLWLAALNVRFRDVRHTLAFLLQLWFFATPIAYPSSLIPGQWRALYGLNPMVAVIEGFRWALLGRQGTPTSVLLVSAAVVLASLVGGLYYFRRAEQTFADVV